MPKFYFSNVNFVFFVFCLLQAGYMICSVGFLSVVLPIIEKRFGLSSVIGGMINTTMNIFLCVTSLTIGLKKYKSPLFVAAVGGLIVSVGCFSMIIPNFLTVDSGNTTHRNFNLCSNNYTDARNRDNCHIGHIDHATRSKVMTIFGCLIFCISFALIGIGAAPLFTTIPSLIDLMIKKEIRSLYYAIYYTSSLITVALSYVIATFLLSEVPNPNTISGQNILPILTNKSKPHDNYKVWWILFVISGAFNLVAGLIALFCHKYFILPKDNIQTQPRKKTESKARPLTKCDNEISFSDSLLLAEYQKDTSHIVSYEIKPTNMERIRYLLTNRVFLLISISNMLLQFLSSAFSLYLPKYIDVKFNFGLERAGVLMGMALVFGGCSGSILGGLSIKSINSSISNICRFVMYMNISMSILLVVFFIRCTSDSTIPSFNANSTKLDEIQKKIDGCVKNCHCNKNEYKPVCFQENNITFPSPCIAGCTDYDSTKGKVIFKDCKCVVHNHNLNLEDGACPKKRCSEAYLFTTILILINMALFATYVPTTEITLLSVKHDDISLAFGFQQILQRLIAQTVGPLTFAKISDISCKQWKIDECTGTVSNCLEYDTNLYGAMSFYVSFPLMAFNCIITLLDDSMDQNEIHI